MRISSIIVIKIYISETRICVGFSFKSSEYLNIKRSMIVLIVSATACSDTIFLKSEFIRNQDEVEFIQS